MERRSAGTASPFHLWKRVDHIRNAVMCGEMLCKAVSPVTAVVRVRVPVSSQCGGACIFFLFPLSPRGQSVSHEVRLGRLHPPTTATAPSPPRTPQLLPQASLPARPMHMLMPTSCLRKPARCLVGSGMKSIAGARPMRTLMPASCLRKPARGLMGRGTKSIAGAVLSDKFAPTATRTVLFEGSENY